MINIDQSNFFTKLYSSIVSQKNQAINVNIQFTGQEQPKFYVYISKVPNMVLIPQKCCFCE